jgi:hypothetical protein
MTAQQDRQPRHSYLRLAQLAALFVSSVVMFATPWPDRYTQGLPPADGLHTGP